jgi:RNA polymerase sigma factor (sigma-70 family)
MSRNHDASSASFDDLLSWLDPDREAAARQYEEIRRDLIKIFGWNRCLDPEGMADETFERVANKAKVLKETFEGNPKLFFYGVANNLIKEDRKRIESRVPIEDIDPPADSSPQADDDDHSDELFDCLEACLKRLSSDKCEQLKIYYGKEKRAKIDQRLHLANRFGISVETLRVRMHRIRVDLERCIERCLSKTREL